MVILTQVETLHKMFVTSISKKEYNPFYETYISKVQNSELLKCLEENKLSTLELLNSLAEDTFNYAYEEGKWTIKQLLQHIIDTERIFAIRALRIARNDKTMLPGFDQDEFDIYANANNRSKSDLLNDYKLMRENTIAMISSFSEEMLVRIGAASDSKLSARAACFIIAGHENHHIQVLKERYL